MTIKELESNTAYALLIIEKKIVFVFMNMTM